MPREKLKKAGFQVYVRVRLAGGPSAGLHLRHQVRDRRISPWKVHRSEISYLEGSRSLLRQQR